MYYTYVELYKRDTKKPSHNIVSADDHEASL